MKKYFVVLTGFSILVALVGFIALIREPYLGIRLLSRNERWFLSSVDPDGPANKLDNFVGCEVIAIGGFKLGEYDLVDDADVIPDKTSLGHFRQAQRYFDDHIKAGIPIVIDLLLTKGRRGVAAGDAAGYQIRIVPSPFPFWTAVSKVAAYYLLALVCLLTGLVVVLKRSRDVRARVFFFMILAASLVFFPFGCWSARDVSYDFRTYFLLFDMIAGFAFIYCPSFFLHFCLVFPRRKRIAGNRGFIFFLYVFPAVLFVLMKLRLAFDVFHLFFVAILFCAIAAVMHSYYALTSPDERAQVKWILWGAAVFAIVFVLFITLPALFSRQNYYDAFLPAAFFTIIPVTMAIAITKYHLMDIDTLVDNTFIYGLTLGILVLLDMGILSFFGAMKSEIVRVNGPIETIAEVWLIIFAYVPVRTTVKKAVKKVLKREDYSPKTAVMKFSRQLLSSSDILSILGTVSGILNETVYPLGGFAYLKREGKYYSLVQGGELDENMRQWTATYSFKNIYDKAESIGRPQILSLMNDGGGCPKEYSGGVIVPLISSTSSFGYITLKNKCSGRLYSSEDIKLLNAIADQTSLAIENMFNRKEAEGRKEETCEEKRRISRELHDGIGSNFTNAIMLADLIDKKVHDTPGRNNHLANLRTLLIEGLSELRDIVWAVEEEQCSIGDMVLHIEDKARRLCGGDSIHFEVNSEIEHEEFTVSPARLSNIMRIIQESMINIIKHAGATEAHVLITEKRGELAIKIGDNGKGFEVSQDGKSQCHGLKNIRKRCEEISANLTIRSEGGKGTTITLTVTL